MRLVSLFCLIALVLVALLLSGHYDFVLAHHKATRFNNGNFGYKKRAMSTVAASTSANGSTGSSASELPSAASNDIIENNSAATGTKGQDISPTPSYPSILPVDPISPSKPSNYTSTTTSTSTSTSTSTNTSTNTSTSTSTNTTTTTAATTTTTTSNTTTTSTNPITVTPIPSPISSSGAGQAPQTSDTPTTTFQPSPTSAVLSTPIPNSVANSVSHSSDDGHITSQDSPINSNSDPATSQPSDQQANNQNPTADAIGSSDSGGGPGGSGDPGGSGGNQGTTSATDNPSNQNFVSQGATPNKLLGPVIGGTIATLAGFGMVVLVVVRKQRKCTSLGVELQSNDWDDYDSLEAPSEPVTRFRPASFLIAVRSVVNKLPLPRDSANITGESRFVEKMDFDEY